MKKYILILLLLLVSKISGQTEGVTYGVLMWGIRGAEMDELKKQRKIQDDIIINSAIIAAETAAIVELETTLLESKTKVQTIIDDATNLLALYRTSEAIVSDQEKIYAILQDNNEFIPIALRVYLGIVQDVKQSLEDLNMASKEGEYIIMDNKGRLDLVFAAQDELSELKAKSTQLLRFLQSISSNYDLTERVLIDYSEPIENTRIELQNLLIND